MSSPILIEILKRLKKIEEENKKNVDFIVEQGNSEGWFYRKWYSGLAECRGTFEFSGIDCTSSSAGTYYTSNEKSFSFPSGVFSSVENCFSSSSGNGVHKASGIYTYRVVGLTNSGGRIEFRAHTSTKDGDCFAFICAYGRWK